MGNKGTGERLEFYNFSDVTVEHLHRYAIAKDFVLGKVVLDIASGEGYGSYLLSDLALEVVGVDIDNESVENAQDKYLKDNLKYLVGSADNIPVESNSIDIVVSFETIEHHDKHEEMFLEIKRVLKDDGVLIMSSPDKKYYSDIPKFKNKFHVKELYFDEFECLTKKHFSFSKFYLQKAYNLNSLVSNIYDFNNIVVYSGDQSNVNKSANQHLYILTIAAQHDINELPTSFFNGADINKVILENHLISTTNKIRNTTSYKFGNLFIRPIYILIRFIKKRFA
jgi:ubiquinone/menaquinone biosynthesis C-methylase UbiE